MRHKKLFIDELQRNPGGQENIELAKNPVNMSACPPFFPSLIHVISNHRLLISIQAFY